MKPDWAALRVEYISSTITLRELARKHGIKAAGVMARAAKEKWEDQRKQESARVSKAAADAIMNDRVTMLAKFNEDDLRMARAIRAKAAQMMMYAERPSDLRAIASAADIAQKIGRLALGVETEVASVTTHDYPTSIEEFV